MSVRNGRWPDQKRLRQPLSDPNSQRRIEGIASLVEEKAPDQSFAGSVNSLAVDVDLVSQRLAGPIQDRTWS